MRVFRIAAARVAKSRKEAFSGEGGAHVSARWHSAGYPVVYVAQSLSLTALEILVPLKSTTDTEPFHAFEAEIPDRFILKPASLPAYWQTHYEVSRAFGDAWLEARESPALRVPTVITPGEWNVLLNPLHPAFTLKWVISGPSLFTFDARLLRRPRARTRRGPSP